MMINTKHASQCRHPQGSVYLVTLITVAAIASMILIGFQLRSSTSTRSTMIQSMSKSSTSMVSAAERAFQTIANDPDWVTTAQGAKPIPAIKIQQTTLTTTVTDADTLAAPSDTTTNFRLSLEATSPYTYEAAQVDVLCSKIDYLSFLQSYDATHYWPMNEPERSTAADEVIDGCDGTYLDEQVPGTGTNDEGGTVPIFGSSNDHIELQACKDFESDAEGSISMWIRTPSPETFVTQGLIGLRAQPGGPAALSLTVTGSIISAYFDDDEIYQLDNYATSGSGVITAGQWHHVLFSWGPAGLYIFVDGVQAARNASNTDALFTYGGRNTPDLHIGRALYVLPTSTTEVGFAGSIAHVAFLEPQLTIDQAAELASYKPDLSVFEIVEDSWARVFQD